MTYKPLDLDAIRKRAEKAQVGPWRVHEDGKEGDDWPLAHFGECVHHNKNKIWVTTDRLNASRTNGACPCDDAYFTANAKTDVVALLSEVQTLREAVKAQNERLRKIASWLKMLAENSQKSAKACRFESLRDAYIADGKNYMATLKSVEAALSLPAVQALTKETEIKP